MKMTNLLFTLYIYIKLKIFLTFKLLSNFQKCILNPLQILQYIFAATAVFNTSQTEYKSGNRAEVWSRWKHNPTGVTIRGFNKCLFVQLMKIKRRYSEINIVRCNRACNVAQICYLFY